MNRLQLTPSQVKQLILAIDITENTTEGLTSEDLERLGIELDKAELFALASTLEAIAEKNQVNGGNV